MEKVVLERVHGGQDGISWLLPCRESGFEQIITTFRWSIKDNNN